MFARSRLCFALALVAGAGLAGCSLYAGDGSDNLLEDPDATGQCVRDTIAQCYLDQLPADTCADLVLSQCNLTGPGPTDPTCYDEVVRACLEAGGDPMLCDLRASESCNGPGPGPDPDCFDRVWNDCVAMNGDPQQCAQYADQVCYGTPCPPGDPMCTPTCVPGDPSCDPDPDCFDRVFADCVAQGRDPMTCAEVAAQTCGPTPCDPMTDPTCGGPSCHDQVLRDCLDAGGDPMTCEQRAIDFCGQPPPPCDPNDPGCTPWPCPPGDPMCPPPPPCDPMTDPTCGGPSCHDQVLRDCLQQGLDPMTCEQLATEACNQPPCDPMTDPTCGPPPCDPMTDPTCGPPPCSPGDPMCPYP